MTRSRPADDPLEDTKIFAAKLKISLSTLRRRRLRDPAFPTPAQAEPSGKLLWRPSDRRAYVARLIAEHEGRGVVAFLVKIPPDEVDEQLKEKLQAEWPGILRWAIDGCLKWQNGGSRPPASVFAATEEYLEAEDTFGSWRAECLVEDPRAWAIASSLWDSWKSWAERAGEQPGSRKAFTQALKTHGYEPDKQWTGKNSTKGYRGLKLRDPIQELRDVAEKADPNL